MGKQIEKKQNPKIKKELKAKIKKNRITRRSKFEICIFKSHFAKNELIHADVEPQLFIQNLKLRLNKLKDSPIYKDEEELVNQLQKKPRSPQNHLQLLRNSVNIILHAITVSKMDFENYNEIKTVVNDYKTDANKLVLDNLLRFLSSFLQTHKITRLDLLKTALRRFFIDNSETIQQNKICLA